jgi:hypothetical protein
MAEIQMSERKKFGNAGVMADTLIFQEIDRQDAMWGVTNNRADTKDGQLMLAGMAQLDALFDRLNGEPDAFASAPEIYPPDWSGFRDYGSDVANLVVAAAFIRQEIQRKIAAGEDTHRKSRDPVQQPYAKDQPATILA